MKFFFKKIPKAENLKKIEKCFAYNSIDRIVGLVHDCGVRT